MPHMFAGLVEWRLERFEPGLPRGWSAAIFGPEQPREVALVSKTQLRCDRCDRLPLSQELRRTVELRAPLQLAWRDSVVASKGPR